MRNNWIMKIKSKQELISWSNDIKEKGYELVFTNGCFDILHRGHLTYLYEAKSLGDFLIVAINSDSSVKKLKGANRPINEENDRALALSALSFVDAVVIFEDDTPLEVIEEVIPDILVKGDDYSLDEIIGKNLVEENGGIVKTIDFVKGYSTSEIVDRIKKL